PGIVDPQNSVDGSNRLARRQHAARGGGGGQGASPGPHADHAGGKKVKRGGQVFRPDVRARTKLGAAVKAGKLRHVADPGWLHACRLRELDSPCEQGIPCSSSGVVVEWSFFGRVLVDRPVLWSAQES